MANDQNIKILDDRAHCLLRPGIYVGAVKPEKYKFWVPTKDNKIEIQELNYIQGEYKLFCEVLDNSLDEVIRGFGTQIDVSYNSSSGFITVRDYGRGIPIDMHKDAKIPTPQVVFSQLKSGSNFTEDDRRTVGMNGMGAALATIFSEKLIVQIWRDNKVYSQTFSNNMEKIGSPTLEKEKTTKTGTLVKFKPDPKIFSIPIPIVLFHKRCLDIVHMYPKLTINLTIESDDDCFGCNDTTVYKSNGWESFIKMFDAPYSIFEDPKAELKMAIVHNTKTEQFEQYSNINGADTFRGGTHVDALRDLICENIKDKIKKDAKLEVTNGDIAKNMIVFCFQVWNAPHFEGQNKEKFVNDKTDVKKVYDDIFSARRLTIMDGECPQIRQATIDAVLIKNERKELLDLKKTQKNIDKKKIAKLIDCSSKNRAKCSLYITEGDSAISNLATVRDSKTMAGLPLRGKVLNVFEESARDVVENKEIQSIMSSIGLKIGESPLTIIDGQIVKNDLYYGNIILATDQDMDGYSIRCLLMNFFWKFWPEIIQYGCVYILETPLYEAIEKKSDESHYFYTKEQYEKFILDKKIDKYEVSYFKGLGSCGKEAWDYMINKQPNLIRMGIDDPKKTTEKLKVVFGQDTDARKKWIMNT